MSDAGTKPGAELELVHVTPEMIEAGLKAIDEFELLDVWEGYLSRADLVATIYRHMDQAARGKPDHNALDPNYLSNDPPHSAVRKFLCRNLTW